MGEAVFVTGPSGVDSEADSGHAPSVSGPLRVLACSGSLDGGGSERQLWQLVSRLDRQRFSPEVYLLARRGPYLEQLPSDVPVHAFEDDYPAPRSFPPGRITYLQSRHLRQIVRQRKIDVVYDRTFHMTLLTGWALASSTPRVSVIVSPPSRDVPASEHRFVWLKRRLLARAYRSASATLCVSEEVASDAANFYRLPPSCLQVMPNPIDVELVRQRATQSLAETAERWLHQQASQIESSQTASSQIHAALIGRFTAEKGHQFALQVAAEVRRRTKESARLSLHLHLVGNGPLQSEIEQSIDRLQLQDCVHLHGYLTNPYPVLAACDLALVPSDYEGFPNVALEALALGVPLVMTNYGATARHIAGLDDQRATLIPVRDVSAAAQSIIDFQLNPQRARERALAGRAWVEAEHALAPWLDRMMNVLERVCQRRNR
ncbi:MAG: glycosyltransferase [Pirellulaceae bacterium]|nr:glycosyltransferase [Pirellulaceae bacterium]